MTGTFMPTTSSNTLWFDENMEDCLTSHIESIEDDVAALETSKANLVHTHSTYADLDHTHSNYAAATHTHTGYAATAHTHTEYADADHTHTGFASTTHSHSEYALATDVDALETKVGDTTVASQISSAIASKADVNHTHTEYAETNHGHSEYATVGHTHSGFALENHDHADYALTSHSHTDYAEVNHSHSDYASSTHTHNYNDLEDKPIIPTTLPANGGNADTVDGKHASDFAAATDFAALQALVGDSSVYSQISTAIAIKADSNHTHSVVTTSAAGLMSADDKTKLDGIATGANKTVVDSALSSSSTNPVQNKVINSALDGKADADHVHNVFSSLTELGITTFPTTMKLVSEAMPKNSMIIIDTRRINGTGTDYGTETISDWGNDANGMAIITRGVSTARVGMLILYGTTATTSANIHYGSYAHDENNVNWVNIDDDKFKNKLDKNTKLSAVDLNTITEPGLYYVSSGTTDLHFPTGSNGHMLVMSDGARIRQVFFRVGTIDTNSFQWYSRNRSSVLTEGLDGDGWSQWWMLSGLDIAWSGTAKLNAEINLGSRYGCQGWVIAGQPTKTDTFSTIYIPRYFLTTDTDRYKLQIADETGYVSFYFYYKTSDNNVYAKVVWVSDTTNSALRYAYRIS